MLTKLSIGNFKAFGKTQHIPLKPITLVFGANSSGKSSILHALLLAHQSFTTADWDVHRTTLGGDSVDLGGFANYIHNHEHVDSVALGLQLSEAEVEVPVSHLKYGQGNTVSYQLVRKVEAKDLSINVTVTTINGKNIINTPMYGLGSVEVGVGNRLFFRAVPTGNLVGESGGYLLENISFANSLMTEAARLDEGPPPSFKLRELDVTLDKLLNMLDSASFREEASLWQLLQKHFFSDFRLTLWQNLRIPNELAFPLFSAQGINSHFGIDDDAYNLESTEWISFLEECFVQAVGFVSPMLLKGLANFEYLGPLRSYPNRLAGTGGHFNNEKSSGWQAWDNLLKNTELREQVNKWLGSDFLRTGYRLTNRTLYSEDDIRMVFDLMSGEPDRSFKDTLSSIPATVEELKLVDLRNGIQVGPRDVGVGISQVLPILASAFGSKEQLIMVEQPEIHIHPALQAEMGDVFIESALGGAKNQFILETHSEHLLLRIMKRMRQTANGELPEDHPFEVRPKNVAVLYVEPGDEGAVVKVLELDEEGQLLDPWPGGFFEEGFEERFG